MDDRQDRLQRLDRRIAEGKAQGIRFGYHEEHPGEPVIEQAYIDGMRHSIQHHPRPTPDETVARDDDGWLYFHHDGSVTNGHGDPMIMELPCNFLMVTDMRMNGQLTPDEYRAEIARLRTALARGEHW